MPRKQRTWRTAVGTTPTQNVKTGIMKHPGNNQTRRGERGIPVSPFRWQKKKYELLLYQAGSVYKTKKQPTALRSRWILSEFIFACCVWLFDRAYNGLYYIYLVNCIPGIYLNMYTLRTGQTFLRTDCGSESWQPQGICRSNLKTAKTCKPPDLDIMVPFFGASGS